MSTHPQTIGIISGTDRAGSNTERVARAYERLLKERGVEHTLLQLGDMPRDLDRIGGYGEPGEEVHALIQRHIIPHGKLVFILPEYNGSLPGILKLFLDTVRPRDMHHKKAALVGVSDGHSGNLRGLDHLTAILHYLRVDVLWQKPKLSGISKLIDINGALADERSLKQLTEQVDRFLLY